MEMGATLGEAELMERAIEEGYERVLDLFQAFLLVEANFAVNYLFNFCKHHFQLGYRILRI